MSVTVADVLDYAPPPYLRQARAYPFLKWAGGKRAIVSDIARRLPPTFGTYWEPFVGGGAVFFALDRRLQAAQLSDVNVELVRTYQVIRDQPERLIAALQEHAAHHSQEHYLATRELSDHPRAVEIAARMIYLNKTCFNGLYRVNRRGEFNVPMGSYKNPNICDAPPTSGRRVLCSERPLFASETLPGSRRLRAILSTATRPTTAPLPATTPAALTSRTNTACAIQASSGTRPAQR